MTDPGSTRYLLLGGSGRLGRLCAAQLALRGIEYGTLQRSGELMFAGKSIGSLRSGPAGSGGYVVIDTSVDYGSLQRLVSHEDDKFAFLTELQARGGLAGLLAFSSGVVEFADVHIKTAWHRVYKRLKKRLEELAGSLQCPAYCPRIFVLIGASSFAVPTTGWVDVVQQVCAGDRVGIGAPDEARSWVAEDVLSAEVGQFFDSPGAPRPVTPLSGVFSLGEVARITARQLGRAITIEAREMEGWLDVPYVSTASVQTQSALSLASVLAPLVARHWAALPPRGWEQPRQ